MKPAEVASSLVAALPRGTDATWSHLQGMGRGAWLVQRTDGVDVVVRQASECEERATRAAADVAVGPVVLASAEGWMATEHLAGVRVTALELGRPPCLEQLAALLRRLHSCDLLLPEAPLEEARGRYVARLGSARLPHDVLVAIGDADRLEQSLTAAHRSSVPAHLDVAANLLMTPSGLRLIDFEYAAAADPARELGQVIWEAELTRGGAQRLVSAYGGEGVVTQVTAEAWAWITGVTWTVWALSLDDNAVMQRYGRRSWERLRTFWWRPAPDLH